MNSVDDYARLKDHVRCLQGRCEVLRFILLQSGKRMRGSMLEARRHCEERDRDVVPVPRDDDLLRP